jgi:hypothetical protein
MFSSTATTTRTTTARPDLFTGVPLAEVGTWNASAGTCELTRADLAEAVRASKFLPSPVLKLGHTDPRFNSEDFDADPALGRVTNLRTVNHGRTLVGDLVNIPAWFARIMPEAFPQRSIEAYTDVTVDGHRFGFALTGLALLGSTWPAVTSLADLRDLYT